MVNFEKSTFVTGVTWDKFKIHKADGDTWPQTWAADGNIYAAAGDNLETPLNFWRVEGHPDIREWGPPPFVYLVNNHPVPPEMYANRKNVHPKWGVKPGGVIAIGHKIFMVVQYMNFGDNPEFNRQHNISCGIYTTDNYGKTWDLSATPPDFFSGRFAAPHFLQFGKAYEGARDNYVYAYFPAGNDGQSYWDNADIILLGRVPKDQILNREKWEFFAGINKWTADGDSAEPVFSYYHMTGENHVAYHAGIGRYLMGNYGFTDLTGNPYPYHQDASGWDPSRQRSELSLFEAEEPWGPWKIFYRDNNWANHGGYGPSFPTKWMDGNSLWMLYSASKDEYNFSIRKLTLELNS